MATPLSENSGYAPPSHNVPPLAHEADSSDLGALLRHARERRGLTLQQISNETKIPWRHLEALEHDNLAAVPGGLYRRAEIRAYARAVHLDQDLALAQLERALEASVAREPVPETTPRTPEPALSHKYALIAIGVVVAAAMFWRVIGGREPALDGGVQVRGAADSPQYPAAPARQSPPETSVRATQRIHVDQAPPPSATSDGDLPAAAAKPAPAPASPGAISELVVTTEPEGARVTVNGIGWGFAPVTIRYLPPGDKRIRVTKEGYVAEERVVRLAEGPVRRVDIRLRTAP